MPGDRYWSSAEGRRTRDQWRSQRGLWATVEGHEPPQKRGAKQLADLVRAQLLSSSELWRHGGEWPKPRAEVAIDAHFQTSKKEPPRVDGVVKWLLDELGSTRAPERQVVYRDDRQVSMLFAAISSSTQPSVRVRATTSALTREAIRRAWESGWQAGTIDDPWLPEREYDDDDDDFPDDDVGRRLKAYSQREKLFRYQRQLLRLADLGSGAVLVALAHPKRPGLGPPALALRRMATSNPYVFDLGHMPSQAGETSAFEKRMADLFRGRVERNPLAFPLKSSVGLTLFLARSRGGADLDNALRLVIPEVLRTLRPPGEDQHPTISIDDEPVTSAGPEISFIEAMAIPAAPEADLHPGRVTLALSNGFRYQSWWEAAECYLDRGGRDDD